MMSNISYFLLLTFIFLIQPCNSDKYFSYRSQCRRDVLFKASDRDKILVSSDSGNLVQSLNSRNLATCAHQCSKISNCASINYNVELISAEYKNCEVMKVSKTNASTSLQAKVGWIHYEPVSQTGPRCRLVTCNAGYRCVETCDIISGYRCIDINECASNPCQNGATCNNEVNRYTCTCVAGYTGTNCQTDINECASNPCQNGATCNNEVNRYTCTCVAGYTGTNCQTDINECASSPCLHGSACSNHLNRYTCSCSIDYAGSRCQLTNIARGRPTFQTSTWDGFDSSSRVVNGQTGTNYNAGYCSHTGNQYKPWWRVDFGAVYNVGSVKITNRGDCCNERLANYYIFVGNNAGSPESNPQCYYYSGYSGLGATSNINCYSPVSGRYLMIMLSGTNHLSLCQVRVFIKE